MIEMNKFRENQSKVPLEELMNYNGQYVAWSDDGTHILASDSDHEALYARLHAKGYDMGETLIAYIDVPEEVSCGGALLFDNEIP
jgi:hypothetical protein